MRLHRFYIDQPIHGGQILVTSEDFVNQLRRVFRFQPGNQIIIFDGLGTDWIYSIGSYQKNGVILEQVKQIESTYNPKRQLFLFQSLIKKDKFEWVLEKGTEIGVSHFIPVIASRTEKTGFNYDRAKKVIIEAAEQSGRNTLPRLYETYDWQKALDWEGVSYLAFHPEGKILNINQFTDHKTKIGALVGPEGGWGDKELEAFKAKKIPLYSLGPQILRSETAAVAIASLFLLT